MEAAAPLELQPAPPGDARRFLLAAAMSIMLHGAVAAAFTRQPAVGMQGEGAIDVEVVMIAEAPEPLTPAPEADQSVSQGEPTERLTEQPPSTAEAHQADAPRTPSDVATLAEPPPPPFMTHPELAPPPIPAPAAAPVEAPVQPNEDAQRERRTASGEAAPLPEHGVTAQAPPPTTDAAQSDAQTTPALASTKSAATSAADEKTAQLKEQALRAAPLAEQAAERRAEREELRRAARAEQKRRAAAAEAKEAAAEARKDAAEARRDAARRQAAAREKAEERAFARRNAARGESAAASRAADAPARASGADIGAFRSAVAARVAAMKRYPSGARGRGETGRPIVAFSVAASGGLGGVSLTRSSGHSELDAEALSMVRRAAPFPRPPIGAPRSFSIGVSFDLR